MTDDEFLATFEASSFTRPEWTHEAHVRMAWLYLTKLPEAEALARVRAGIQKLNAKIGSPDGYHETITVVAVRLIARSRRANELFAAFRERNPELFDRKLSALLRFYSKERLWSPEARAAFVEPDLEPLPITTE